MTTKWIYVGLSLLCAGIASAGGDDEAGVAEPAKIPVQSVGRFLSSIQEVLGEAFRFIPEVSSCNSASPCKASPQPRRRGGICLSDRENYMFRLEIEAVCTDLTQYGSSPEEWRQRAFQEAESAVKAYRDFRLQEDNLFIALQDKVSDLIIKASRLLDDSHIQEKQYIERERDDVHRRQSFLERIRESAGGNEQCYERTCLMLEAPEIPKEQKVGLQDVVKRFALSSYLLLSAAECGNGQALQEVVDGFRHGKYGFPLYEERAKEWEERQIMSLPKA
jgi:hypothetical protein